MENPFNISNTGVGTAGGTLLVLFLNINVENIFTTIVQAAVAATVSFGTSVLLRRLVERTKQKQKGA